MCSYVREDAYSRLVSNVLVTILPRLATLIVGCEVAMSRAKQLPPDQPYLQGNDLEIESAGKFPLELFVVDDK